MPYLLGSSRRVILRSATERCTECGHALAGAEQIPQASRRWDLKDPPRAAVGANVATVETDLAAGREIDPGPLESDTRALSERLRRSEARAAELEALALRDPLTGLLNRRAFSEQVEAELARARRSGYRVAFVALDIDVFKQINDLCGHAVGDQVLRAVAGRLTSGLRPGDLCCRLGGDEFVLALPSADVGLAEEIVNRLRESIASIEFGPGHQSLSISAGIAAAPSDGADLGELMEPADRALYRAKAAGRHGSSVASANDGALVAIHERPVERHLLNVQNAVGALARAIDARNGYTHLHSHAVAFYAASLAEAMGLDADRVELVRRAGVLHDVGKIGVPDAILWKDGALDPGEADIMRRHSSIGRDILVGAGLPQVADCVAHLHERFDGEGYPDGLIGEALPLESRLLAVADALDAMTSPHLYRQPLNVDDAAAELKRGAGTQFDPLVVDRMLELLSSGKLRLTDLARKR